MSTTPLDMYAGSSDAVAAAFIDLVLHEACEGDHSRLIGKCTEAQIIAFLALTDLGETPAMHCGSYHGPLDDSARSLFGPHVMHSWLTMPVDGQLWVVDPTRWVFQFETQQPHTYIAPMHLHGLDDEYRPGMTLRSLPSDQEALARHLAECGLKYPSLKKHQAAPAA